MKNASQYDDFFGYEELSVNHVDSGLFLAAEAVKLENKFYWDQPERRKILENEQITDQELGIRSFAFVTGSIFASIAFLNAAINEVFIEAAKYKKEKSASKTAENPLAQLPSSVIDSLAEINPEGIKWGDYKSLEKNLGGGKPFSNKFQLALYLAHGETRLLACKGSIWKEVGRVAQLRNFLIHHEPMWVQLSNESYQALGDSKHKQRTATVLTDLKNRGFRNRLYEKPDPSNIGGARDTLVILRLGAESAVWAIRSSLKFAHEFYKRMPIVTYNRLIEDRLEELQRPQFMLSIS
jgi:hypothetical protein